MTDLNDAHSDSPSVAVVDSNDSITLEVVWHVKGDGFSTNDGLLIASGTLTVNAIDDGIRGKDYQVVENWIIQVGTGGEGLISDNEEKADRSYLLVKNGDLNISAGGDSINAQTDVMIINWSASPGS